MPRPNPPPPLIPPTFEPFKLEPFERDSVARTIGYERLPSDLANAIEHVIACFHATKDGSLETTVANTIAALDEILAHGRTYQDAVQRLANDKSGVDYTTHGRLQPLALAVICGDISARDELDRAAREERARLADHSRTVAKTEALRFFCGVLRVVFDQSAAPTMERTLHDCRVFALEVLTIAGIEEPDFGTHPERLEQYLQTDISSDDITEW